MAETIRIDGLKELEKTLRELTPMIQGKKGFSKNILRNSARAMANKAKEHAKAHVPVDTGRLKEAITIKLMSVKYRDRATRAGDSREYYYLGYKTGMSRKDPKGAYYGTMVEVGAKTELGTEIMPPRPYLRPAVENNKSQLIKIFTDKFGNQLEVNARRLANRNRGSRTRAMMKGRL